MEALVCVALLLAIVGGSDAGWCVCKSDANSVALQKALDYACGAGADCSSIIQNGACYNPNSVVAHCSYAANSYYQRKGQAQGTCDFAGAATLSSTDPSGNGCTYPGSPSSAGTSTATPSGNTALPTTPSNGGTTTPSTNPGLTTPNTYTPTPTGTGGVYGGLGPSGNSISTDPNDGGFTLKVGMTSLFLTLFFSCIWSY